MSDDQKLCHDLLNQLTVVTAHCEIMAESAGHEANRRLKIILDASSYMVQLIENYRAREEKRRVRAVFAV